MSLDKKISSWILDYAKECGISSLVVGVSGGIDSALTSTLCAMTGIKTIVVTLPINQKYDQVERSYNHIEWLKQKFNNITHIEVDLTDAYLNFINLFNESDDLVKANTKSRLRMVSLYHISGIHNGIVVGTGNKIEDFCVGFFTKYGDGGVDISPIGDLTKSEVKNLSIRLGINKEIVDAQPTDGLWDIDRTDEEQIGASYDELEQIMKMIENNDVQNLSKRDSEVMDIFLTLNRKNKHKMLPIPVYKK
jgi:NAD+ synthase